VIKELSIIMLVLAVSLSLGSRVFAQERLRLAWAGFSPTNSPIWVIEDRKLLQKMGVQPEIIAISASPTVLQALLANEIDAASISVTTLTSSRLAGADTVMIVGVVPTFVDHIVSLSSITSVEQLKGKTAGVNRLGSTSDLGLRLALRKLGIDPDKDVKIIPTGGTAERFAALSKGITQFTIIPEPFLTQAEKLGFRNLDPDWCNFGQGQPEVGEIPGAPPRLSDVRLQVSDFAYGPVGGIDELKDAIAENYWWLHRQPRSAWTFEMDLRPWCERW
jgi:ABC-type nitrate/sulfonate/bicarbonate transport system substrate-binding protein